MPEPKDSANIREVIRDPLEQHFLGTLDEDAIEFCLSEEFLPEL